MEFEIVDDNIRAGFNCNVSVEATLENGETIEILLSGMNYVMHIYHDKFKDAKGQWPGIDISDQDSPFYPIYCTMLKTSEVEDIPHPDLEGDDGEEVQEEENEQHQERVRDDVIFDLSSHFEDDDIIAAFKQLLGE